VRLAVTVAFAFALLLGGSAVHARDSQGVDVETAQLDYHVPQGCPDEHAFVEGVLARTQRARFTATPSGGRRFSIDVERRGARFVGTLIIVRGEERARREITNARCSDVISAFVFFVSIAMDPERSAGPSDARPAPPDRVETPPHAPDHAIEPPRDASEKPSAAMANARPEPRPRPPSRDGTAPSSFHLAFGSGALAATGVAEPILGSAHPVADLASDAAGLSPSVRVGLLWGTSRSQLLPPAAHLTVGLRALMVSGCALRLPLASANASVRMCVLVEGGILQVRPFAVRRPTEPDRPWFAVGPMLRAEIELLPKLLSLGVDAAIAIPLEREEVHLRAGPTVELVGSVGLRLGAVVLVRAF
jgi:hypothetical protein